MQSFRAQVSKNRHTPKGQLSLTFVSMEILIIQATRSTGSKFFRLWNTGIISSNLAQDVVVSVFMYACCPMKVSPGL
jgi:hypothetical protein